MVDSRVWSQSRPGEAGRGRRSLALMLVYSHASRFLGNSAGRDCRVAILAESDRRFKLLFILVLLTTVPSKVQPAIAEIAIGVENNSDDGNNERVSKVCELEYLHAKHPLLLT